MTLRQSRRLINALSLLALLAAFLVPEGKLLMILVGICAAVTLFVLWQHLPELSGISKENPKTRTLRSITVFNVIYLAVMVLLAVLAERCSSELTWLTERHMKLLMAMLLAVPMATLGNLAPKLPFNRYTGLRLPWTVRDEETWIVAHRILGWLSIPLAILLFAHVPTATTLEGYMHYWWTGILLVWIGVPGFYSGLFYWKKWRI